MANLLLLFNFAKVYPKVIFFRKILVWAEMPFYGVGSYFAVYSTLIHVFKPLETSS